MGRKNRHCGVKGYITVFLALIMTVLLSLVLTLFEGARSGAARLRAECAFHTAAQSSLGEFHQEMLEQFDIFYIDTSYGSAVPDYKKTQERIRYYIDQNIRPEDSFSLIKTSEWVRLGVDELTIDYATVATDSGGAPMRRQISEYMKDKIGISYLEKAKDMLGKLEPMQEIEGKNDMDWNSSFEEAKELSGEEWTEVETHYPVTSMYQNRDSFTLSAVMDFETERDISKAVVNLQNYVTLRQRNQGSGYAEDARGCDSLLDRIYFTAYIQEKFSSYLDDKESGSSQTDETKENEQLRYQMEYILGGKASDYENLEYTANRILLLREAANALYLPTDEQKMNEMQLIGDSIAALTGCAGISPAIVAALICAWSYWESLEDLKILLKGDKVPIAKTSESWKTDFESLLSGNAGGSSSTASSENTEGFNYEDYLFLLICSKNSTTATYHCMDLMEMQIRKTEGNEDFRLDGCLDSFYLNVTFRLMGNQVYQIKRRYGYYK